MLGISSDIPSFENWETFLNNRHVSMYIFKNRKSSPLTLSSVINKSTNFQHRNPKQKGSNYYKGNTSHTTAETMSPLSAYSAIVPKFCNDALTFSPRIASPELVIIIRHAQIATASLILYRSVAAIKNTEPCIIFPRRFFKFVVYIYPAYVL